MKIYITALHLKHGGVEMAISSISNGFIKRGYEVCLLVSYDLGEPSYYLDPKVEVQYLTTCQPNKEEIKQAIRSKNPFAIVREGIKAVSILHAKKSTMIKAIKNIQEGTIISTRNEHSVLLSKYGNQKVHKIAQLHHDHLFQKKMCDDFKYRYQNIDEFLLLTEELRIEVEEMIRPYNKKTRCLTMPNFLPESTKEDGENKQEEVQLECLEKSQLEKQNNKQFVAVGRMDQVKGFDRLIACWKQCVEQYPDWKLKLIGGGELQPVLERQIQELGLEQHIEITGMMPHEQVLEEMRKSYGYLMSSYSEGFPLVLIEAMQEGCPIVAFDVRVGPRAIIDHNVNGYLIEDGNQKQYVDKIVELIESATTQKNMSKQAVQKSQVFTEHNIMNHWVELMKQEK